MAKRKVTKTPEELEIEQRDRSYRDQITRQCFFPPVSPEKFNRLINGAPFRLGGLIEPKIIDHRNNVHVLIDSESHAYGKYVGQQSRWFDSHDCILLEDVKPTQLYVKAKWGIQYRTVTMDSLIHHLQHDGVDVNPSYQRGHVWTDEHRTRLLDTIFTDGDIGKMVVYSKLYSNPDPMRFEVIDGKQRISTIFLFVTDQFQYRGYWYSELSFKDRMAFNNAMLQLAIIDSNRYERELTEHEKIEIFLQVNATGIPQSDEFIETLKGRIKND